MLTEDVRQHRPQFSLHFAERISQLQGRLLKSSSQLQCYSDITPIYKRLQPVYKQLQSGELFILIEPMLQTSNTKGVIAILWGDQHLVAKVDINQLQLADPEDGTI
jgi:hypothetical protein